MNATGPALFVTVIAVGVLFAFGAGAGLWLWDRLVAHVERTELETLEEARDVTGRSKDSTNCMTLDDAKRRHPSGAFRLDDADGVRGGDR
jgi:hypothetical protein